MLKEESFLPVRNTLHNFCLLHNVLRQFQCQIHPLPPTVLLVCFVFLYLASSLSPFLLKHNILSIKIYAPLSQSIPNQIFCSIFSLNSFKFLLYPIITFFIENINIYKNKTLILTSSIKCFIFSIYPFIKSYYFTI